MDVNKFLQGFGLLFVFLGAVIGVGLAVCGAALTVPVGMSAICPYCGRKVRTDADGGVK